MVSYLSYLTAYIPPDYLKFLTAKTTIFESYGDPEGIDHDTLNFLSAQLFSIILGLILRNVFNRNYFSAVFRHQFCFIWGIVLVLFCYDYLVLLELLIFPLIVKLLITSSFTKRYSHYLTMVFGIFITCHAHYQNEKSHADEEERDLENQNNTTISLLYMCMLKKLSALAYSCQDGKIKSKQEDSPREESKLTPILEEHKILKEPTLLEIYGYSFSFTGWSSIGVRKESSKTSILRFKRGT